MFQKGNKYGFKKGVSGNPACKPRQIVEVARAAREHTLLALETLRRIASDKDATHSAQVAAAIGLLDRGWGRAPQHITVNDGRKLADLSENELIAIAFGTHEAASSDSTPAPQAGPKSLN
jgi:hypothetical protein